MKTLYYGGPILTLESPLYAQALLVEDGRIAAVGGKEDLLSLAGRDCVMTNLQGAALLPAFIDPHSHFSQVALSTLNLSVQGAKSAQEMAQKLREALRKDPPQDGAWVRVDGYDHTLFALPEHPDLALLDSIAPGHPLMISHRSGHMGLMNTLALQACGITANTPDPQGGRIGRDEHGAPNGYLEENAFIAAQSKLPMPSPTEILQGYRRAQQLYAAHGIATVQEGMLPAQLLPLYGLLQSQDLLKLDLVAYADVPGYAAAKQQLAVGHYEKHIRLGGMKMFLDGSPQGRTAWMRTPYLGEAEYCGYPTMQDEQVEQSFLAAAAEHTQILAHCNGDAAAQQYLDCLRRAAQKAPELKALRPVMIHAQLLAPDQIPTVAELGVVLSFFVAHIYHWGDIHIQNFGMQRASLISPAASALQQKVPFTFHQDSPVILPDMLETLWCAMARQTRAGVTLGTGQAVPALAALRAVTTNAAYQYFEEQDKGTLHAGKAADLVMLDRDPLVTPADELRNIQVLRTIKGGETLYEKT